MKFSIIIPTYNRADEVRGTLCNMAMLTPQGDWEVIVVDNNSTDDTRAVVEDIATWFPVKLHYLFEQEQGRCAALNRGILAAHGEIILTTDDDVRVAPDWLDQAASALAQHQCDYVGGKVLPIWGGERPAWLPNHAGRPWSVIALLDHGEAPLEFNQRYVPLGVNLAFRRDCFTRAGLWDNRVGRKAGTLLGQEVREWGLRAKAAGLRGFYAPQMVVQHIIPQERLSKRYFRRWFYWNGISRALLYEQARINMESPEDTSLDFANVPHLAGVPRYMLRTYFGTFVRMLKAYASKDIEARFERELELWFFAGVVRQRWKDRKGKARMMSAKTNVAESQ
ncbi:MAG: glycosyltransferase family 2 protein [Acidobacteria bacterium]|nr:glycosyltransferase family 2 protein [Acidobacteriota bacterium]